MNLLNQIKEHEGFRSEVYECTEGYDTIGYGFAIKDLKLGGIGISYIEMIPLGLRIGILTAIFISVWRNLLKDIRNN